VANCQRKLNRETRPIGSSRSGEAVVAGFRSATRKTVSVDAHIEQTRSPRLLRRSFAGFLVTLIVIVLTFLAIFAASLYEAGRQNAVSRTAALEQYVRRSLEVSAVIARDALGYLHRRDSLEGLAEDYDAHLYFSKLSSGMSLGEGMVFIDGDGTVVLHSDSFPAKPVDLSDRAWFQAHVDGADDFIDGSFISRITDTHLFVHTFALRDDDGSLQGIVNIGIPSDEILGALALPFDHEGGVTSVVKETGELIARDPFPPELIGARFDLPDQMENGSAVHEQPLDGRRALTAYARLEDFGLVASVSIPLAAVFQPLLVMAAATLPLLAAIVFGALVTLRRLEAQQRRLARSAVRLETVLKASSLGAWQWFPKTDRTEFMGRWAEMLGYRPEDLAPESSTWTRLLHPDEKERLLERVDRTLSGEQNEFREEHRMRHKDGHWVWVLDSGRVVERDADGKPEVVIGIHLDISERREAEEQMRVISGEVDHRSKNLLAVVQALVSMTKLENEGTFKSILRGRIHAMARAHELLSRSRWKGADLRVIAEEELGPFIAGEPADIVIDGPRTILGASAVQPVALTLHELATNSAKYGALSALGRLRLTWRVPEEGPAFTILWEEATARAVGGRLTSPGFGSRLMRLMIEEQLGGTFETEWTDDGLRCKITIPKSMLVNPAMDQPAQSAARHQVQRLRSEGTGRRILLVEDEVLVSAEMALTLKAAGYDVAGPASTLQAATSLAHDADIEVAVLDINLGGELSFPVADILVARGVPFVFITGYEHDRLIPGRFGHAPVVSKPYPAGALERALADAVSAHVSQSDEEHAVS
jgi:PAS domain S-box-containing protein